MITQSEIQFQGLALNDEKKKLLHSPLSVQFTQSLNQASKCKVCYPLSYDKKLFHAEREFNFPSSMRIKAKSQAGNKTTDFQLFNGVLDSFNIDYSEHGSLEIEYIDPLVSANEIDHFEPASQVSIESAVKKLFANSFAESKSKKVTSRFRKGGQLQLENLSNLAQLDLDFLKRLCQDYGFRFYYDHDREEVVLFLPDFSETSEAQIDIEALIPQFKFESRLNKFPTNICVKFHDGEEKLKVSSKKSSLSACFAHKHKVRDSLGLELDYHFYRPNIKRAEAKAVSEAHFFNLALQGDIAQFRSTANLKVGSYLDITRRNKEAKQFSKFLGKYLITDRLSKLQNATWSHQYRGVRP